MSKSKRATLLTFTIYTLLVLYIFQAQLFETPSIMVDHFAAGAGSIWLFILPVFTLLMSILPFAVWPPPARTVGLILRIAATILPLVITYALISGLQRYAPHYDEKQFIQLITEFDKGSNFTQQEVQARLGEPLSREKIKHEMDSVDREYWSFTYMPSTGFGWNKRIIIFSTRGFMIDYDNMDEP
ncbi:MAG TPA: hypothetical protein VFF78_06405 [Anaerolineaceae bacterium]|nr:hypothetical protein [Anaerolineaceae bacterium]